MPVSCFQGPAGLDGLDGKDGKPGFRVRRCTGESTPSFPKSQRTRNPDEGTEVAPPPLSGGAHAFPWSASHCTPPPWVSLILVAVASLAEVDLPKVRTGK